MALSAIFTTPAWQVTGVSTYGANGVTPQTGQTGQAAAARKAGATDRVTLSPSGASGALPDFSTYGALGRRGGARVSTFARPDDRPTGATFAADIARRIETDENTDADALSRLESSLARTMDNVSSVYGRDAATALMGAVYKKIGEGPVNEDALGAGFLDAIRIIDKNFGVSAGDSFMETLNGDLNKAMNAFFENGAEETFFAVTSGEQLNLINERAAVAASQLGEAVGDMIGEIASMGADATAATKKKKSLLAELQEKLEEKLQEKLETARLEKAVGTYSALDMSDISGQMLDLAV